MGREIRKVPKGWEHPKSDARNEDGYQSMHKEFYEDAIAEWWENHTLWLKGAHPDQLAGKGKDCKYFAQWNGNPPDVEYYNTFYRPEEATCFQMYQTVSEGTPVSPVFDTLQELEDWLVNKKGYTRSAAHSFCEGGWAPSFTLSSAGLKDGISSFDL